jgi:hypothetical protein
LVFILNFRVQEQTVGGTNSVIDEVLGLELICKGVVWLCISWYWVLMAGQAVSISRGINGSWALYFSWGDDFNLTRALLFRFAHAVSHKVWYFQIMVVFVLV